VRWKNANEYESSGEVQRQFTSGALFSITGSRLSNIVTGTTQLEQIDRIVMIIEHDC
jgi:hypothetical protein